MDTTVLEPDERTEDDRLLLLVPVRSGRCGSIAVRTGRLPDGRRVGLAFTCETALAAVFGAEQKWIPLNARVARWMFAEAGAEETRVDAVPFAPAPALMPAPAPAAATLLPEPSRAVVPAPLPTLLPTPRPERATVAIAPKPLVALQTITPTSTSIAT
uniref:SAV_915 family protein n=1 Tax=Catenulispora pinisilvae TaxID=2705253 RepID=UPI0018910B73